MPEHGTEALDHTISVRVSRADRDRVGRLAARVRGIKPGAVARELLLAALKTAEANPAALFVTQEAA